MKSFTEFSQLRQWMVLGFRWILDCLSYCMIVNPGCFLSWVCFPLWRMQVERWPKWAVWPWWKRSAEVIYLPVWLCRSVVGWTLNCGGGDSGVQCGELIDNGKEYVTHLWAARELRWCGWRQVGRWSRWVWGTCFFGFLKASHGAEFIDLGTVNLIVYGCYKTSLYDIKS